MQICRLRQTPASLSRSQHAYPVHMKNENHNEREASDASAENKAPVTKLPKMEMYAVLGLELSQKILRKLESLEDSVEILAREKARELRAEECGDVKDD